MAKAIGPTFEAELGAAGLLGLQMVWRADGSIDFGPLMTSDQIAAVQAVYAAHDPAKLARPAPPEPRAWLERLSPQKQSAIMDAARADSAILLWVMKASGSINIDVSAAETIAGVAALVTAGILDDADAALLLAP